MDDSEKGKIRAAFDYMGPRTQAGLTLEALAKGAGILIKFREKEIAELRADLEAVKVAEGVAVEQHNLADLEVKLLKFQNIDLKSRLLSICNTMDWFIAQVGANSFGADHIAKWEEAKAKMKDAFSDRKCDHSEIMHNTKTDKHRCGVCYEELGDVKKCDLCELWRVGDTR